MLLLLVMVDKVVQEVVMIEIVVKLEELLQYFLKLPTVVVAEVEDRVDLLALDHQTVEAVDPVVAAADHTQVVETKGQVVDLVVVRHRLLRQLVMLIPAIME